MTILNQTEIMKPDIFLVVFFLVGVLVSIILLIVGDKKDNAFVVIGSCVLFCICFVFTLLTGNGAVFAIKTERNQYECTIDDSASFTDIASKYNVVEQRGEIWVLEDKDDKSRSD